VTTKMYPQCEWCLCHGRPRAQSFDVLASFIVNSVNV